MSNKTAMNSQAVLLKRSLYEKGKKMRIITEQSKTNPVLADVAIEAAKRQLLTLPWVDQAFGRVWPIPMQRGDKNVTEPCVYCNGNRYETLVPSADLGNYTFFVLMDSARYDDRSVESNVGCTSILT